LLSGQLVGHLVVLNPFDPARRGVRVGEGMFGATVPDDFANPRQPSSSLL
jgi:hypothetical protein